MTVVGHMEQLRLSACYQKSGEMTCLTCHHPHQKAAPKDSVAYYRQKCLSCHSERPCGLDQTMRLRKDPADNCASCHMPRARVMANSVFTDHWGSPRGNQQDRSPQRFAGVEPYWMW